MKLHHLCPEGGMSASPLVEKLPHSKEKKIMATKVNNLEDLYIDLLKDLYSAETQIEKALPKMAKAAQSPDLKKGFEEHLNQTHAHVERLKEVFSGLDASPKGKKCVGMEGLLKESDELMKEDINPEVLDAGLIAAAQKVEHYEIASYGTALLLQKTLDEEGTTNKKLTKLAVSHINSQASQNIPA
jgi:ferritin-like metal-binding protein YciE